MPLQNGEVKKSRVLHMTNGRKSTYVLVHGAWHGGWCWKKVTPCSFDQYAARLRGRFCLVVP
jgi:hypothetical protein